MPRLVRASFRLVRLGWAFVLSRSEIRPGMTLPERAAWQRKLAARMLRALEVEVVASGVVPRQGMIVANHLGYLDVLVIAAQGSMVFVAKSDVRSWPFIGSLLENAGAILAERERRLSSGRTVEEIRQALAQGLPVMLFPEGTSSDGSSVLPFKPTLLQAAIEAGSAISPAAISYRATGGCAAHDICYWGDHSFFPHLIRLAGLEKAEARLSFGNAVPVVSGRKAVGEKLHAIISEMHSRNT